MEDAPPQRRWWKRLPVRLSVRALMILVLVLGVVLGRFIIPARAQREAVEALSREGATIRYDWQGLDFRAKVPPPGDRLRLREVMGPHYFDTPIMVLGRKELDDRLMTQVGRLDHLRLLSISTSENLSPVGAGQILSLKHLEQFYVNRGTPRGFLPHLETMMWVRDFGWGSPDATEADMAAISRLSQLERLSIDGTPLTESGLMHLTKLKNLRVLNVHGPTPKLDWEARLRFTRAMPNLRLFNLDGRQIINKQ